MLYYVKRAKTEKLLSAGISSGKHPVYNNHFPIFAKIILQKQIEINENKWLYLRQERN